MDGRLDVLLNNAGWDGRIGVDGLTGATALKEFGTNVIRATQSALPLLRKSGNPVVVNVSSGLSSSWAVTNPERNDSHYPTIVYSATKAAVSMPTVEYAKALPEIKVQRGRAWLHRH